MRPIAEHKRGNLCSVLYLLRRELLDTAGWKPELDDEQKAYDNGVRNRLFASLIVMFTGFDLLAKFQLGDSGVAGERFKKFLTSTDGGDVPDLVADIFYGVRNSLVHSFSVPDSDALQKLGMKTVGIAHHLGSDRGVSTLTVQAGDTAVVYVDGVFRTWILAIGHYRDSLYGSDSADARTTFQLMFDKYGTIHIP